MSKARADSPVVYVVDDDRGVRESLRMLLDSVGIDNETFESARHFLDAFRSERIACLVADIRMPGMNGLELQRTLNARRASIPIIFITGHGDVPMAVGAMKDGAMDFLTKPFREQELLDRIRLALERAQEHATEGHRADELRERYRSLTPREAEVMALVVKGSANKVIAMDLGVSQRTVELHRSRVMKKMAARSLAELVRFAEQLD